jgi:predicted nucleotidyltransferase
MPGLFRIKKKIKEVFSKLHSNYKVSEIYIFGSFSTKKEREKSDVDILVEFTEPVSLFTFLSLKSFLEKILGRKVDLVTKKGIKKEMAERILAEAIKV